MGNKKQTTTSTSSTTPYNLAGLQDIFASVQNAAKTPYQAYTGDLTAGLTDTQQSGISNINAAYGAAQPDFNTAANYATQGAASIRPEAIQQYMSPYTQQVVDATRANFNESNAQQQSHVLGNAAARGALGGDRVGVAQAELARQQKLAQDPVIANLYQTGYGSALSAAQADRAAQQQATGQFLNLGNASQNALLQGAQAQLGAGAVEQQTAQAGLDAAYQQYLQQLAYPYQQAAFYATYGLPAATGQGTTSSSSTTQPGQNTAAQIAGLGISALGLFSDERVKDDKVQIGEAFDGTPIYKFRYKGDPTTHIGFMAQDVEHTHPYAVGSVGGIKTVDYDAATKDSEGPERFAKGGAIAPVDLMEVVGYVPKAQGSPRSAFPQSQATSSPPGGGSQNGIGGLQDALKGAQGSLSGLFSGGSGYSGAIGGAGTLGGMNTAAGWWKRGGAVPGGDDDFMSTVHAIRHGLKMARGGAAMPDANGGTTFDDRWGNFGDPNLFQPTIPADQPKAETDYLVEVPPAAAPPIAQNAPVMAQNVPDRAEPAIPETAPSESPMAYAGAPAGNNSPYALTPSTPLSLGPQQTQSSASQNTMGGFNPFNLSDKARSAIIAAGLGIAASRSPNALSAVAEGGLHGLGAYNSMTREEREAADKKAAREQNERRIDLEAKRLTQSAEQFAKNLDLSERKFKYDTTAKPELKTIKDAMGNERLVRIMPDGRAIPVDTGTESDPTNPYATGKMTEGQANAATYATRMIEAEKILRDQDVLKSAGNWLEYGAKRATEKVGLGSALNSTAYQKLDQAQRNFINAVLRRESGAVISDAEFENARQQYFPQPWDNAATLEQKQQNRVDAIRGIGAAAGAGYAPKDVIDAEGNIVANAALKPKAKKGAANASPQTGAILDAARTAIAKGAPREAVIKRLRDNGIDPSGL